MHTLSLQENTMIIMLSDINKFLSQKLYQFNCKIPNKMIILILLLFDTPLMRI